MEYRSGKIGRIFAVRFDDGDDFLASLEELIVKENIRNGWFHVIGGLRQAGVVTGPQEPVMPPEPVWQEVDEVREVLGAGSIYWDGDKPKIHLHAALGHHGDTLTGCVRRITKVYLVLEVYLMELAGFAATRPWYEKGGFNRLTFV
jgi:predicted DNA-binding protein with PD1-like motif